MSEFWSDVAVYGPGFLTAAWTVLWLTLLTIALSWFFGLAAALGQRSDFAAVRALAAFYVWFIRGTPALIQIFIIYFGMPQMGVRRLCDRNYPLRPVSHSDRTDGILSGTWFQSPGNNAYDHPAAGISNYPAGSNERGVVDFEEYVAAVHDHGG
jgi:His/Glu/Gln/Arg/opine family amino acid ABC transporter permease subunit